MRKFVLLVFLVSLMVFPNIAQAQNNVQISEMTVQFWPEYDSPDMLVMYSFVLSADTPLPAEVKIRIPANANLNAVAKTDTDSLVNTPYDAPVKEGDSVVITIPVDDLANYRVEYYVPIEKNGSTRSYDFVWESDQAINSLYVQFQQPPTSSSFTSSPMLPESSPASGGIVYHALDMGDLAAGSEVKLSLSYEKDNDDLTVSSMPIEVGGGSLPETNESSSFSSADTLPIVLVGLGILLIVGGLVYFFMSGRSNNEKEPRKRHTPRAASDGGNIYCHECGSRASSGDKFCRSCGVKLRL